MQSKITKKAMFNQDSALITSGPTNLLVIVQYHGLQLRILEPFTNRNISKLKLQFKLLDWTSLLPRIPRSGMNSEAKMGVTDE